MTTSSAAVKRGCGTRVKGGLYLETKLSPWGTPVDDFILDPPEPIDIQGLGISPIGQKLIQGPGGVWHVVDWVGSKFYPNVEDFIRETKNHGLSRRASRSLDLSVLTKESRLMLLHSRAIIRNARDYWLAIASDQGGYHNGLDAVRCLDRERGNPDHAAIAARMLADRVVTCAGLWAWDVEGGERVEGTEQARQTRTIGDTTYETWARVDLTQIPGVTLPPEYQPALFAAFPIGNIAIINDPDNQAKVDALRERVEQQVTLPVYVEDQ